MKYEDLTIKQQNEYKLFCDEYLGKSYTFSENKEPLYFDDKMNMYSFKNIFKGIRKFKLEKLNNIQ